MKTTKKQFELFKKYVRQFVKEYSLGDWEVNILHTPLEKPGVVVFAGMDYYLHGRHAVIMLNTDVDESYFDTITNHEIKRSALHEVAELRYAKIRALALSRKATEEEIDEAIHELIQVDTNMRVPSKD